MNLEFHSLKEIPNNQTALLALIESTWSKMILSSTILKKYWQKLYEYFPEYQLILKDGKSIIGYASLLPFHWDMPLNELPDKGWDWLLEQGVRGFEAALRPNYLGGLLIGVDKAYRGKGLSNLIIGKAKEKLIGENLQSLVIPIRPTWKDQYPETPMEEYSQWKKEGKIFDPWIRTHVSAGAKIIKVCNESMRIEAPIQEWEDWTGKKIEKSGQYPIEGALSLVNFSTVENKGLYAEPNVWIYYEKED